MAIYIPESRRRQRLLLAAAAALLVGLVLGWLGGRLTAPGLGDYVRAAATQGRQLEASMRFLPIEYARQYAAGAVGPGTSAQDTVDRAARGLDRLLATAPWLGPADRTRLTQAVGAVPDAARRKVTPEEFGQVAEQAAATVAEVLPTGG